ncbi:alpha-L-fucosidase C-terminal domain-containing protein [Sphingomonas sp. LR59]|uniref:alpha-L-fucosidase C-terminal domain-containing protein n=1 Tax=Sphingomonas sp. LR59 TaxID=3050232 RepID=UPI002FE01627
MTDLAPWMAANGEAIHGTRPWTIYGEGPTTAAAGAFAEKTSYTPQDIRFTTKGETLYAITLGTPRGQTVITSLAQPNPHERRRVRGVRLLGRPGDIAFRQTGQALLIDLPATLPTRHASAFAIDFA